MKKLLLFLALTACGKASDSNLNSSLIGGQVVDQKDWPASVYASMGSARCTATIVGERVLLIASHCVGNGGRASFKTEGESYSSICTHSPLYDRGNSTADWALCLTDKPVKVPAESLNTDMALVKVGEEVLLTGYGCIHTGGGGGNDGKYRVGTAKVTQVPKGGSSHDIVTKGSSALCFGDSGGPAFKVMGAKRVVISVNSRGDIRTESYLSSVHTKEAQEFFKAWADKKSVKICGVHLDAAGCRK